MQDELRTFIENYDHAAENEARKLYVKARNAATELRVTYGAKDSLREADEIDALADRLRDVFEAHEGAKINHTDQ
jgi:hypothetical protein